MKAIGRAINSIEDKKVKKSKKKNQSDRSLKREDNSELFTKKAVISRYPDSKSSKTIKTKNYKFSKTHKHTDSNNTYLTSLNNSSLLRTTTK
jgi:hypothetical protein